MNETLHIVYNETVDPKFVVGIIYAKRARRDLGRFQIDKAEWEAFCAALEGVATFGWGFN